MSKQLKRFVTPRVLVWMLALSVMFFSLTAAPSSKIEVRANGQETHITYYTDSTYSTACGYTIILCQGYRAHNGCTTAYSTVSYVDCMCEEIQPC
jgi:hypothetical protein